MHVYVCVRKATKAEKALCQACKIRTNTQAHPRRSHYTLCMLHYIVKNADFPAYLCVFYKPNNMFVLNEASIRKHVRCKYAGDVRISL